MMKVLVILILVLVNSCAQLLLKIGSSKKSITKTVIKINIQIISGYLLLFISTIISVYLLNFINFKSLTIVIALNYVSTLILSNLVLKEKYTKQKIVSTIIIVFGVITFNI